ncbi:MAG: hypothetical protein ABGZ53_01320 [Fuerstiella sp.]
MRLDHAALVSSLQLAYSAERAAALAYIGHARSLKKTSESQQVQSIERDEWDHRRHVLSIMQEYEIPISRWLEVKFYVIGKLIASACHVIGRFMPYFFAGKLESGNVCEYFVMIRHFRSLGISKHDQLLWEMGIKEKEHEVFFLQMVRDARWFPLFERVFRWGINCSANNVDPDADARLSLAEVDRYCDR